jgi:hypothetical protein
MDRLARVRDGDRTRHAATLTPTDRAALSAAQE